MYENRPTSARISGTTHQCLSVSPSAPSSLKSVIEKKEHLTPAPLPSSSLVVSVFMLFVQYSIYLQNIREKIGYFHCWKPGLLCFVCKNIITSRIGISIYFSQRAVILRKHFLIKTCLKSGCDSYKRKFWRLAWGPGDCFFFWVFEVTLPTSSPK